MSKNGEYTLVLTCKTRYWCDVEGKEVDLADNYWKRELNAFLSHFDKRSVWDGKNSVFLSGNLGQLINKYKYTFDTSYSHFVEKDEVVIEITVYTDALGSHLDLILDSVENTVEKDNIGFSDWLRDIGYHNKGWKKINPEKLVDCKHTKYKSLTFAQKGDDLVEVCKCDSCGKTFYKVLEEQ